MRGLERQGVLAHEVRFDGLVRARSQERGLGQSVRLCGTLAETVAGADLVVEAIIETEDAKRALFDQLAGLMGPIRITNWGGMADVKAIPNAYDLTMTPRHLEPHSDNPYRDPVPGYILLHSATPLPLVCSRNSRICLSFS